ncbi:hypothetical protein Sgleb_51720 [Streptomyces glebosus]|uniref:Uncharacterized protein n=1 Tax=Streptomyces glebosus TaxID=249580 RepID=A0A640T666_9ACTN|nr:hypothetical protein Sgleb_51720 [Streptomyces glebosus]
MEVHHKARWNGRSVLFFAVKNAPLKKARERVTAEMMNAVWPLNTASSMGSSPEVFL